MEQDNMEIGETGLIPTHYGFFDTKNDQRLNHEGEPITNEDVTKED